MEFEDGTVSWVGSSSSPRRFFLKDHEGSVRVVVDGNGQLLERKNYYPSGMLSALHNESLGEKTSYGLMGKQALTRELGVSYYTNTPDGGFDPHGGDYWKPGKIPYLVNPSAERLSRLYGGGGGGAGFGGAGAGLNGHGHNGVYFDWQTSTYRSVFDVTTDMPLLSFINPTDIKYSFTGPSAGIALTLIETSFNIKGNQDAYFYNGVLVGFNKTGNSQSYMLSKELDGKVIFDEYNYGQADGDQFISPTKVEGYTTTMGPDVLRGGGSTLTWGLGILGGLGVAARFIQNRFEDLTMDMTDGLIRAGLEVYHAPNDWEIVIEGKQYERQLHHWATNKSNFFKSQMQKVASQYGLNLNQE